MPSNIVPQNISMIGREADDRFGKSDLAFYEWIAGEDPDKTVAEVLLWLFDELKEETDETAIRVLLDTWKQECDETEFKMRLKVLDRLMPAVHPFHEIKKEF